MLDQTLNKICYLNKNDKKVYIDQFIIELHQDEILNIPFEILRSLVDSCTILNDLRTIFIVHNKRFLGLLNDDTFLAENLSNAHHNYLKQHRILSILPEKLQSDINLHNKILKQKEDWLIKPSLFGKGEGIVFGKNVNEKEWIRLIDNCILNSNKFLIQEYIKQAKFTVYHEEILDEFNLAGTLLCFDTQFLSPGIFRASNKDLISLNQGGFILYPIEGHSSSNDKKEKNALECQKPKFPSISFNPVKPILCLDETKRTFNNFKQFKIPSDAYFNVTKFSFEQITYYEMALLKYGIALLQLNFEDSKSTFFTALVNQLGIPLAHSSKNDDFLWHIKPSIENGLARSHSQNVFEMHTDASFESTPPRYIGMQVIREDKCGGGYSLLLSLSDIINELNENEINLLSTTMFKFRKPKEFYKCGEQFTYGPILSPKRDKFNHLLCRYRNDIILDRDDIGQESKNALNKFEKLINLKEGKNIEYHFLKENSIILLDNCRYLHGRTKVNDPNRHLTRIRFQTKYDELLPVF
jgi:alpha-ketoglutarate-dependent taurine dioxygenase